MTKEHKGKKVFEKSDNTIEQHLYSIDKSITQEQKKRKET